MNKVACLCAWCCLAGCASSGGGGNSADAGDLVVCPRPLPMECPSPPPSYQDDIEALVEQRCLSCHGPGGKAYPTLDFKSYDRVHAQRTEILSQVYNCRMPPEDGVPLTADELDTLLQWLVCGAPDN